VAHKNWFRKHEDSMTVGDSVASGMGSWRFIIIQTVIVILWMVLNVIALVHHWDPYPFILLNLLFSTQAAYAAPIIMMSQNRAAARDKIQAEHQYKHQELELQENTELTKAIHELTKMVHDHIVKEK